MFGHLETIPKEYFVTSKSNTKLKPHTELKPRAWKWSFTGRPPYSSWVSNYLCPSQEKFADSWAWLLSPAWLVLLGPHFYCSAFCLIVHKQETWHMLFSLWLTLPSNPIWSPPAVPSLLLVCDPLQWHCYQWLIAASATCPLFSPFSALFHLESLLWPAIIHFIYVCMWGGIFPSPGRKDRLVWAPYSWSSLSRPGWPWTQGSTCLCLLSEGIKGVRPYCQKHLVVTPESCKHNHS